MFVLIAIFLAVISSPSTDQTAVTITARPAQIYIARSETGQHLNFDFILKNQTDEKLIINKVEVSVFDGAGQLARREFYDEYGRSSLELAGTPAIEKKNSVMLFNPFHTFAANIPLKKLHYEFFFQQRRSQEILQSCH